MKSPGKLRGHMGPNVGPQKKNSSQSHGHDLVIWKLWVPNVGPHKRSSQKKGSSYFYDFAKIEENIYESNMGPHHEKKV